MPGCGITSQNAREYQRRAQESRRRNLEAKREQEQREAEERERLTAGAQPQEDYISGRLACVRQQLARIDAMLLVEVDPQRLDRLAAASSRLAEQERVLAGRPAPGAYRPSAPRRRTEQAVLIPE